ncbi:MAG: hypothetical protein WAZ18_02165 [Alphaproteobacteria bacterium]
MFRNLAAMFVCATSLLGVPTHAVDALLFVSPLRVEIPSGQDTSVITVTNKSDTVKHYVVQLTDQTMNSQGVTETAEDFAYSSKRMLRFMPRRITLEPGQRQAVRIMARRPAGLAEGDYHTHLLFEEQLAQNIVSTTQTSATTKGVEFKIGALFGVAIPVVVQHGVVSSSLAMGIASFTSPTDASPRAVLVPFTRTGNAEATAMLTVTTPEGTNLISPRRVRVYREADAVVLNLPLTPEGMAYQGLATVKLAEPATDKAPETVYQMGTLAF